MAASFSFSPACAAACCCSEPDCGCALPDCAPPAWADLACSESLPPSSSAFADASASGEAAASSPSFFPDAPIAFASASVAAFAFASARAAASPVFGLSCCLPASADLSNSWPAAFRASAAFAEASLTASSADCSAVLARLLSDLRRLGRGGCRRPCSIASEASACASSWAAAAFSAASRASFSLSPASCIAFFVTRAAAASAAFAACGRLARRGRGLLQPVARGSGGLRGLGLLGVLRALGGRRRLRAPSRNASALLAASSAAWAASSRFFSVCFNAFEASPSRTRAPRSSSRARRRPSRVPRPPRPRPRPSAPPPSSRSASASLRARASASRVAASTAYASAASPPRPATGSSPSIDLMASSTSAGEGGVARRLGAVLGVLLLQVAEILQRLLEGRLLLGRERVLDLRGLVADLLLVVAQSLSSSMALSISSSFLSSSDDSGFSRRRSRID